MAHALLVRRLLILALFAIAAVGCDDDDDVMGPPGCEAGAPMTVTYDDQGTFQTPALMLGGLTVTGSASVNVLNASGLGVVGGISSTYVDGTEFLRFSIGSGAATAVSYQLTVGNADGDGLLGESTIEAFDPQNVSLGIVAVNGGAAKDVSALFAGAPIGAFVVTAAVDYLTISRVDYTPCL
jgi:hypothetical protein